MTTSTTALVIDARARNLSAFVASATKANDVGGADQLILRFALGLGGFAELMKKSPDGFRAEMPVIIMGAFSAMSSAGHTAVVTNDNGDGHRKVIVVGGLGEPFGKGGLKVLAHPITGTFIEGPVRITRLPGAENSNAASADAAWAGVKLLSSIDRRGAFLVEGQSDYTSVWRLEPGVNSTPAELSPEHREEMFSFPNIIRRMVFSPVFRGFLRESDVSYKPTKEEVETCVKARLEEYLEALTRGDEHALSYLRNEGLGRLPWKATEDALREMYASLASTPVEEAPQSPAAVAADEDEYVEVVEE